MGLRTGAKAASRRRSFSIRRVIGITLLVMLATPAVFVALYRVINPPITPLMLIRDAEGEPRHQTWVPLSQISPWLPRAVIASEDQRFCEHYGFDFGSIEEALARYRQTGKLRGASTISQQTAKNLLLGPWHSFIRKGIEAAKKNLRKIHLLDTTIPHQVLGRYGSGLVLLKPAPEGTGVIAGGPERAVVQAAGIPNVLTKSIGSHNPHNVVKATIDALEQLRDKAAVAEMRGLTVEKM